MKERFDPAELIASLESEGYQRVMIARAAGLSKSTITKLASGTVRRPSYDSVTALQRGAERLGPRPGGKVMVG
jgi:lambda repressor-like predicted transcriptional regulator